MSEPMSACTDCKVSMSLTEGGCYIDLCPLHAAAEDMLAWLKLHQSLHFKNETLDALIARVEGVVADEE